MRICTVVAELFQMDREAGGRTGGH
jgi:hypothetical protein